MKKVIWIICIAVCISVLAVSGFQIVRILSERAESKELYTEIKKECIIEDSGQDTSSAPSGESNTVSEADTSDAAPGNTVDFEHLRELNGQSVAWIYSPGTTIDYPVVQGDNNDYYLNHMFNGQPNSGGAIFMDSRNSPDFSDYNTLIYGHRMNNGTMFGSILNYKQEGYYDAHRYMYLYTDSANYRLDVICGFDTTDSSDVYLVPANAKLTRDMIEYGIEHSTFKSGVTVGDGERIVSLSTCTGMRTGDIHRYVLMAKLVEQ